MGNIEFCRHAGRKIIAVDDVMLLTRRNEGLEMVLRTFMDNYSISRKKRIVGGIDR